MSFSRKSKLLLAGGIGLVLAVVGVVVSLILLKQTQDIRQKAAVQGGTAQVRITPTTATLDTGQSTTATVSLSTEGTSVQGIAIKLSFPYTGSTPPLVASDIVINPTILAAGRLNCSIKEVVMTTNPATINVSCLTTPGTTYQSTTLTDLFTFKLTAAAVNETVRVPVTFNTTSTIVASGSNDIAAIPTTDLTVTVNRANVPQPQKRMDVRYSVNCNPSEVRVTARLTDSNNTILTNTNVRFAFNNQSNERRTDSNGEASVTFSYATAGTYPLVINADGFSEQRTDVVTTTCPAATPAPTPVPAHTPTPTPASTPTPARTPTPPPAPVSCNGGCSNTKKCDTGLTCYKGRCRSASCQSDTTCMCQESNVASSSGTAALPTTGGFDRTIALAIIGGLLTLGGGQLLAAKGWRPTPNEP